MAELASFTLKKRNPDVLTCIANLSNDEVFTPPEFAKQMLDTLEKGWSEANNGASIWADSNVKFLDPCTKSGVFLREIVERLTHGLEEEIPDLQTRVDHILTKQVFGIGITHLTSLLARRSVYCSKFANGEHSIASSFDDPEGNIWFESIKHTWVGGTQPIETADEQGNPIQKKINGRCKYCGASQSSLERSLESETHAYSFIHTEDVKSFISEVYGEKMQFDVVIGNPPYQLNTDGFGTQARPIYNLFVEQAKKLEPRFLTMVIPARWYSGGMGLSEFREAMLNDDQIRVIKDFADSSEVFPGTQIKGGVCYFLWQLDSRGDCEVTNVNNGNNASTVKRPLLEPGSDVFIRFNEAISILDKVMRAENLGQNNFKLAVEKSFMQKVSSIGAFGLDSTFRGNEKAGKDDLLVYRNGGVGYINRSEITKEVDSIDVWKVFIPRAGSGSDSFPHPILGKPFVGKPGSISSWTYMHIGPFSNETEANNVVKYISTKLFRFLVLLHKPSQDATKSVYTFVPNQDFSQEWTDEKLYKKYGISEEEINFIESMIRPMVLEND